MPKFVKIAFASGVLAAGFLVWCAYRSHGAPGELGTLIYLVFFPASFSLIATDNANFLVQTMVCTVAVALNGIYFVLISLLWKILFK
jgi:hypothetical protein